MSSESKVEFLRKLVKVKDGLASDVVEKSESKGRRLEMGDEIYCWRERKVCGAGRERERTEKQALGQSESVKGSDFCLLHYGWSFDHRHLYHP
uniref:Uncharacterized protein n=1 Tax=Brassica campestris TaxID=3711 RepID=M4DVK1_BRACM